MIIGSYHYCIICIYMLLFCVIFYSSFTVNCICDHLIIYILCAQLSRLLLSTYSRNTTSPHSYLLFLCWLQWEGGFLYSTWMEVRQVSLPTDIFFFYVGCTGRGGGGVLILYLDGSVTSVSPHRYLLSLCMVALGMLIVPNIVYMNCY